MTAPNGEHKVLDSTRAGDWFQTSIGGRFYPFDPRIEEINVMDISNSISKICRFMGHCKNFYSVAEHCVLGVEEVRLRYESELEPHKVKMLQMGFLLHDAPEAYFGDLIRPVKRMVCMTDYRVSENTVLHLILRQHGITGMDWTEMEDIINEVDNAMLLKEADEIHHGHSDWNIPGRPASVKLFCWHHDHARRYWMDAYQTLNRGHTYDLRERRLVRV